MFSKWRWLVVQFLHKMWVRSALFGVIAILIALLAVPLEHIIQNPLPFSISAETIIRILNILASSMLAVTTFSLGVMVSAFGSASSGISPRANLLLRQDATSQNVLATFLGSFIYSLVGIIALNTDIYGETGRLILFITTVIVIVLIVIALLRWIEHLSHLGRMSETSLRVEQATSKALSDWVAHPALGANPLTEVTMPVDAIGIFTDQTGYVQHVDMASLSCLAEQYQAEIMILAPAGKYSHPAAPLAWLSHCREPDCIESIRNAFSIADKRSFDQDPRFGLSVMAEIASRALSPAVNDPGTAIDIISRGGRVLLALGKQDQADLTILYPRLSMSTLATQDLFEDLFLPIARDGAAVCQVGIRLLKTLALLAENHPAQLTQSAQYLAARVLDYSQSAMISAQDFAQLKRLVEELNL
ncbi:membrane protein [Methylophaga frappieri]|uniref:Membrane protein n=1 Tax=Methylophaga frappieri (strain ATCC BAA-2434 / DSM 25690 / JAM7) TaxID=754477 RepID=I1YJ79_METFJ|nr:DUF2254 domain-containing protein [Methylophaga frappieri]AFJ02972.1 membrane protein [Methylophaga frappieri]